MIKVKIKRIDICQYIHCHVTDRKENYIRKIKG
jgi:hypothetical protein